jgi:hypothetical protein
MNWKECNQLLDSLKGEESVFALYQKGRTKELEELYEIFLRTNLYSVTKLDRLLAGENNRKRNVACVYGEKGTGKSTVVSVAALVNFEKGNIKELHYHRYEPNKNQFDELFESKKQDGKRIVIIIDDLHYFVGDFAKSLLSGKVSHLDKFLSELREVNTLSTSDSSLLLYITDEHSTYYLYRILSNLVSPFDREDLLALFPQVSKSTNEILVDEKFFGRTYSLLGGKEKLYAACKVNIKIVNEEIQSESKVPLKINTPRMFKILMKELDLDEELQSIYEEYPWLVEAIIHDTAKELIQDLEKMRYQLAQEFYDNVEKSVTLLRTRLREDTNPIDGLTKLKEIIEKYERKIEPLNERIWTCYMILFKNREIPEKICKVYEKAKKIIKNTVSQHPSLFSQQDINELEELKDPEKIWEKVNKNAILLLMERTPLPY